MTRSRFHGEIYGMGTSSGTRIVVGNWTSSPLGTFTDVMVEFENGHRLLLAPDDAVRKFVSATYTFDETVLTPVAFERLPDGSREVQAGRLALRIHTGRMTPLGVLLKLVPTAISTAPWFCTLTDPIARLVLRGVRTRGSAGGGRREYYGARTQYRVTAVEACWEGKKLGSLTRVTPPVRFGFGSTPQAPSVTYITTTIDD
ncbi:hypothetical protein [Rhodococcus sp. H29-C3]|uniref:hypothetical protein n=1 Tax=Rhodococcus sp. H29-C3 TaxID=3046307 RepID=UPI0024B8EC19|nr:hypothetical protein [Rhodococcus sp. H29-C3]MDJ0359030.1 hypothetical protein [Rhodococcus sp. H29-C3]